MLVETTRARWSPCSTDAGSPDRVASTAVRQLRVWRRILVPAPWSRSACLVRWMQMPGVQALDEVTALVGPKIDAPGADAEAGARSAFAERIFVDTIEDSSSLPASRRTSCLSRSSNGLAVSARRRRSASHCRVRAPWGRAPERATAVRRLEMAPFRCAAGQKHPRTTWRAASIDLAGLAGLAMNVKTDCEVTASPVRPSGSSGRADLYGRRPSGAPPPLVPMPCSLPRTETRLHRRETTLRSSASGMSRTPVNPAAPLPPRSSSRRCSASPQRQSACGSNLAWVDAPRQEYGRQIMPLRLDRSRAARSALSPDPFLLRLQARNRIGDASGAIARRSRPLALAQLNNCIVCTHGVSPFLMGIRRASVIARIRRLQFNAYQSFDGAVKSRFLMRVGWIIIVHVYFTRPTDWGIV